MFKYKSSLGLFFRFKPSAQFGLRAFSSQDKKPETPESAPKAETEATAEKQEAETEGK